MGTVAPAWRAAVVLSALALAAYFNSFSGGLVLDDILHFTPTKLSNPLQSDLFWNRPLVALTFTANYHLDGMNLRGYHLVNLLIHIAAAVSLFELARRLLLSPKLAPRFAERAEKLALLGAILWLVHPLQTQSVTYLVQRCESMMGLFYLLSLLSVVRARESGSRAWAWWLLAVVSAISSTACKEVAVSIPVVAVLLDRSFYSSSWREVFRHGLGHLAVAIVTFAGIYFTVVYKGGLLTGAGGAGFGAGSFTPTSYLLTQTQAIFYYVRLAFWPSPLCLDYIDWPAVTSFAQAWKTAVPLAIIGLATLLATAIRPVWGFLPATFFLILAPTSSFVPILDPLFEHRMYLPLACLIFPVVLALDQGLQHLQDTNAEAYQGLSRLAGLVFVLVVIIFMIRTMMRNADYRTILQMNADVVSKRPKNSRAQVNLASALVLYGDVANARKHAEIALQLAPNSAHNKMVLATALHEAGYSEQAWQLLSAIGDLSKAAINSRELPLTAALVAVTLKRPRETLQLVELSRELLPTDARNELYAGAAYLQLNQPEEARKQFELMLKKSPTILTDMLNKARYNAFLPAPNRTQARIARLNAEILCFISERKNIEHLDILAIVLAMEGRLLQLQAEQQAAVLGGWVWKRAPEADKLFQQAAQVADEAAKLAESQGKKYQAERLRERQKLFQAQKRYLGE